MFLFHLRFNLYSSNSPFFSFFELPSPQTMTLMYTHNFLNHEKKTPFSNDLMSNIAAELLGGIFEVHLREFSSAEPSVVLLGASTPDLTVKLLEQCHHSDKTSTVHLVEVQENLISRAIGTTSFGDIGYKIIVTQSLPVDLKANPASLDEKISILACHDLAGLKVMRQIIEEQAQAAPLIANDSVDILVMDMLLNRLSPGEIDLAINEAFRVLRHNGRLLMLLLLADEQLPMPLPLNMGDWRAVYFPTEKEIMTKLEHAGYHGMSYVNNEMPATIVHGHAELGVFVIEAFKGKQGVCLEQGHAVIFRGPWREAIDDDGHRYGRGERTAVCAKTYALLMRPPYRDLFIGITSRTAPPLESAPLFDCTTPRIRHPSVTKGLINIDNRLATSESGGSYCTPSSGCC